jgi:hypothetical protein
MSQAFLSGSLGAGEVVPTLAFLLGAAFCGVEEELTVLL